MEYLSAKETADKWGISQRRVALLCAENRVCDAKMVGNMWIIPEYAAKPADARAFRYTEVNIGKARPFLKWVGGKGQLLSEITPYYPFVAGKVTKYAEPFVGGGAVLFDVLNKFDLEAVYISDINSALINAYITIRDDVEELIARLSLLQSEFVPLPTEERKHYYAKMRDKFNSLTVSYDLSDNLEKAALMIFLNKTCFNGLYRVNRKGAFNVPMGAYKNPLICDGENLRLVSDKLQGVSIKCGDYKESADFIDDKTFVYFDPPYRPLSVTSSFTAYSENEFNDDKQIELGRFIDAMHAKGAKIVASNSDPEYFNITAYI